MKDHIDQKYIGKLLYPQMKLFLANSLLNYKPVIKKKYLLSFKDAYL